MPEFGQNRAERNAAAVNAERDRRMIEPLLFQGNAYDFDADSRDNIAGAFALALAASIAETGAPGNLYWHGGDTPFQFRTATNENVEMDAPTVLALGQAAAARKAAVICAAAAMKDAPVLPSKVDADQHWPMQAG